VDDTPPFVGEQDMRRKFFFVMAIAFSARQGRVRALQAAKESQFAPSRSLTIGFLFIFSRSLIYFLARSTSSASSSTSKF
jgi:hypothetical protein